MPQFRKKPVVIEAIQWTGRNTEEVINFCEKVIAQDRSIHGSLIIETLEGNMIANSNDWIIKGVNGEFYPCKPDIFEKTYEPVQ